MNTFSHKKTALLIFLLALGTIVLLLSIFFPATEKKQPFIQNPIPTQAVFPSPKAEQDISITPDASVTLKPGEKQQFILIFSTPMQASQMRIELTKVDITKDNVPVTVPVDTLFSENGKKLSITTQSPIDPYSQYNLLLTNTKNSTTLFKTSFLSEKEKETKAETNNLDLVPYLPYETAWYALSYLPSLNIYVFNFKYDPASKETVDEQYERAKNDAILFIRSKGIDESTIVIEWRYS